MNIIFDEAEHKLATLDDEGHVRNMQGHLIGKIGQDSHVYNQEGFIIGSFDGTGHVYKDGRPIGMAKGDKVFDEEGHCVGKISGDHMESGAAALLLLIR